MVSTQNFKAALDKMTQDPNALKAYTRTNSEKREQGGSYTIGVQQRRFLDYYNRFSGNGRGDPGIYPMTYEEQKYGHAILLQGVHYVHDGIDEVIDFREPGGKEYEKMFDDIFTEMETLRKTQARRKANSNDTLRMLKEYGRKAMREETGDRLLIRNGYDDPRMNHDEMVRTFEQFSQAPIQLTPDKIRTRAEKEKVDMNNLDGMVSSLMRAKKGNMDYYPIYDTSGTANAYKTPLALAAIDSTTGRLHGLLRMDDPDASPIYDKMKANIDACINKTVQQSTTLHKISEKTVQGSTEPFKISESETAGFTDSPSSDMQYE